MPKNSFLTDIPTLRKRARQHIDEGSVTAGYSADREIVLKLLNDSLATELVCVLRYRRHHFMARGIHSQSVAQEFLEHANEEQLHADQISERIVQLGGIAAERLQIGGDGRFDRLTTRVRSRGDVGHDTVNERPYVAGDPVECLLPGVETREAQ